MKPFRSVWIASFALATSLVACSDDPAAPEVAFIQIDPDGVEVEVGQALALTATAFDEAGNKMDEGTATWSSSDPAIATVDESGEVVGVAEGDAIVTATVGGKSGRTNVKVIPAMVTRVEIAPDAPRVRPDETVQLTATAFTARGILPAGREVSWTSLDPDLASVSGSGLVRGREPGLATIAATIEGVTGSVEVEVIPNVGVVRVEPTELVLFEGESGPLAAVVLGSNGATLTDRVVEWSSSVADVATVDEGGVVRALRPGKATIYAEVEGVQNLATVEVMPLPATLRIEPPSLLLQEDTTWGLAAIITDTLGLERPGEGCTWHSLDPEVIRVGDGGAVHAIARGITHVEARCEGKQASIEAEVLPRAALEILGPDRVVVGESIHFEVRAEDRAPLGEVRWAVGWERPNSNPIASIEQDGTLHAHLPGRPFAFVRAEGRSTGREVLSVLRFTSLQSGPWHTCGKATTGEFFCWGATRFMRWGEPSTPPTPIPQPLNEARLHENYEFESVTLGELKSIALTASGDAVTWGCESPNFPWVCVGDEVGSALGPAFGTYTRTAAAYAIFRRIPPPLRSIRFSQFSCFLDPTGRVSCKRPPIAHPDYEEFQFPFPEAAFDFLGFANTSQRFVEVGAGVASICALTAAGEPWCWGPGGIDAEDDFSFEEGAGSPVPAPLEGAPTLASLSVGKYHACGLTPAGKAWCWGHSRKGALGAGFLGSSETPVEVAGDLVFRHVSASIEHTCGLTMDDEIHCWGRGETAPVKAPLAGPFLQVAAGAEHACALRTDGVARCWGEGALFQTADDLALLHDGSPRPIYPENR
ncbi:MAG TPA: Ig-like domain-containing protein [Vulgatibacter sp.]|nr:Ig-like domain-containing protein [Vulgatibacter sp.]